MNDYSQYIDKIASKLAVEHAKSLEDSELERILLETIGGPKLVKVAKQLIDNGELDFSMVQELIVEIFLRIPAGERTLYEYQHLKNAGLDYFILDGDFVHNPYPDINSKNLIPLYGKVDGKIKIIGIATWKELSRA